MNADRAGMTGPGAEARIETRIEDWPIAGQFVIARGAKSTARLVVATVSWRGASGRGECAPYARYGESAEQVRDEIRAQATRLCECPDIAAMRAKLDADMKPGAARNALDCALWDLEAKASGVPVWRLAGLPPPAPVVTAYTISLGAPDEMARAAAQAANRPLFKLKLGGDDAARIDAVRKAAPHARLIVDANESWTADSWTTNLAACVAARVELIEQPFPSAQDHVLETLARPTPVCADESAHDAASIPSLAQRYDAVNVKLDKTGGLTGAMHAIAAARRHDLRVMLGCMVCTSLSIAPAFLLSHYAEIVDLDGPLLLRKDRENAVLFAGSTAHPPPTELWG